MTDMAMLAQILVTISTMQEHEVFRDLHAPRIPDRGGGLCHP
jgi:hypothetical protein